ncbi:MAG TPA: hypothetical protein VF893_08825 [Candidatus Bathyarchaeia archaeon]
MKVKYVLVVAIATMLVTATVVYGFMNWKAKQVRGEPLSVFVGVDAAYDNPEEIKTLLDAISPYTNIFIIGSTGITYNETKLTDLCQYIFDKGLSFIIFTQTHDAPYLPSRQWTENAKTRWGDRFLGFYVYDEVGGKHLDLWTYRVFEEADNFTDARNQFIAHLENLIKVAVSNATDIEGIQTFSSDYALYWFDYKAGYDSLFAEFGWNYSRQLNVALCRGAAEAMKREWGVVLTWTYDQPPYLEHGEKLFEDMVYAYESGAKYIIIFDTNKNYTHGTLAEEHLQAMRQFTEYAHEYPRKTLPINERTAFVLPKDYGYGFRGPTDKIWGLWESDAFSYEMSVQLGSLLEQYGNKLDVIYDDEVDYNSLTYGKFIFWNGTILGGS